MTSDSLSSPPFTPREAALAVTEPDLNPDELQGEALSTAKDRFGFFLNDDFHRAQPVTAALQEQRLQKEQSRQKKWTQMRKQWQRHFRYKHSRPVSSLSQEAAQTIVALPHPATESTNSPGGSPSKPPADETEDLQRQSISTQPHRRGLTRISLAPPQKRDFIDSEVYFSATLKRRIRKGIPDALRGDVWFDLVDAERVQRAYPQPSRDIDVGNLSRTVLEEIERDIDRTFPRHVLFIEKDGEGQCSLRRVLQWYAALDTEVGYCQGMGFVAALFLTYMSEERAFYTFYATLTRRSCPLRMMFLPRLVEMQVMLHVYDRLGQLHLPRLWRHFGAEGVHVTMFFTEWAMAFFCRGFSFELVTRVWDVLLFEGRLKMVYRASLGILQHVEAQLLALSFEKIMSFLRDLPNRIDSHAVVDQCWAIPLKTQQIVDAEEEVSPAAARSPVARLLTASLVLRTVLGAEGHSGARHLKAPRAIVVTSVVMRDHTAEAKVARGNDVT